jgi:uncharacterized protein
MRGNYEAGAAARTGGRRRPAQMKEAAPMTTPPHRFASDVAFSPSVKAVQTKKGSRKAYERVEAADAWARDLDQDVSSFIETQTSFFLATASADGQPYIQHRGGPPGFLHVLGPRKLGFVDFVGNRQYVTAGNLLDNPRFCLFLVDYEGRQRLKIWGEARAVEDDPALLAKLMPANYRAKPERVILLSVSAWDINCPAHIPRKFDAADVERAMGELTARVRALEAENRELQERLRAPAGRLP